MLSSVIIAQGEHFSIPTNISTILTKCVIPTKICAIPTIPTKIYVIPTKICTIPTIPTIPTKLCVIPTQIPTSDGDLRRGLKIGVGSKWDILGHFVKITSHPLNYDHRPF